MGLSSRKNAPKPREICAINALELQVNFSGEVTTAAAEAANYEITLNGKVLTNAIEDIKLTDKTAVLRLNNVTLSTGDKVTVQVSDAVTGERYASEVIEYTSAAPVLTKDPVIVEDTIHLTFDRPVASLEGLTLVKLDGIALKDTDLKLVTKDNNAGNYTYSVKLKEDSPGQDLSADALAEGKHEVKLFDVADAAAKNPAVAPYLTGSYTITEAGTPEEVKETAPIVKSVNALNANKFEIEFDQPLANNEFDLKVIKGNHTFAEEKTYTNPGISSTVYRANSSKPNTYVVIVTGDSEEGDLNPLYKAGKESVDLSIEVTNHKSATELLVGKKDVKKVTLSKADGKPKAEDGTVQNDTITLPLNGTATFTADYGTDANANANNHIVLRNADGVVIENQYFEATMDSTKPELVIKQKGDDTNNPLVKDGKIVGAPFTVEFKANTMQFNKDTTSVVAYNLIDLRNDAHVVSAVSVEEPTVDPSEDNFKYYVLDADNIKIDGEAKYGQININYGKEMDKATALDINNYKLDGEKLPAGSKAEFLNDTKTVAITVPEGTFKATTDYRFQIETDVLTKAGQKVVRDAQSKLPVIKIGEVQDNEAPYLVGAEFAVPVADKDEDISKVKTTNLVKLTFSEAVELETTGLDEAVEVMINDVKYTGTVAAYGDRQLDDKEKNTDRVLVLTLADKVGINQDATVTVVKKDDSKDYAIKDADDNKVKPGSLTLKAGKTVKVSKTQAEKDAEQLVEDKKAAKQELKAYKTADYTINKADYDAAVTAGEKAIDNATDKAGVSGALATAKAAIDAIDSDTKIKADATAAIANAKTAIGTSYEFVTGTNLTNNNSATLKAELDTKVSNADITLTVTKTDDNTYSVTISHENATDETVAVAVTVAS